MVYAVGDCVFTKIKGYPPWPSKVTGVHGSTPSHMKYDIYFYGTAEVATVKSDNMFPYLKYKAKFGNKPDNKKFMEGMRLIEEENDISSDVIEVEHSPAPTPTPKQSEQTTKQAAASKSKAYQNAAVKTPSESASVSTSAKVRRTSEKKSAEVDNDMKLNNSILEVSSTGCITYTKGSRTVQIPRAVVLISRLAAASKSKAYQNAAVKTPSESASVSTSAKVRRTSEKKSAEVDNDMKLNNSILEVSSTGCITYTKGSRTVQIPRAVVLISRLVKNSKQKGQNLDHSPLTKMVVTKTNDKTTYGNKKKNNEENMPKTSSIYDNPIAGPSGISNRKEELMVLEQIKGKADKGEPSREVLTATPNKNSRKTSLTSPQENDFVSSPPRKKKKVTSSTKKPMSPPDVPQALMEVVIGTADTIGGLDVIMTAPCSSVQPPSASVDQDMISELTGADHTNDVVCNTQYEHLVVTPVTNNDHVASVAAPLSEVPKDNLIYDSLACVKIEPVTSPVSPEVSGRNNPADPAPNMACVKNEPVTSPVSPQVSGRNNPADPAPNMACVKNEPVTSPVSPQVLINPVIRTGNCSSRNQKISDLRKKWFTEMCEIISREFQHSQPLESSSIRIHRNNTLLHSAYRIAVVCVERLAARIMEGVTFVDDDGQCYPDVTDTDHLGETSGNPKRDQNKIKKPNFRTLLIENLLVDRDRTIRASLNVEKPELDPCITALKEMELFDVTYLMLKKYPEVVGTLEKVSRYSGVENIKKEDEFLEKEQQIRTLAVNLYRKFARLYNATPVQFTYIHTFEVKRFQEISTHMELEDFWLLQHEPTVQDLTHSSIEELVTIVRAHTPVRHESDSSDDESEISSITKSGLK